MLCNSEELNPNAEENAPFCQEFMESGICSKEQAGERCVFRHIKADHIECVVKKIRDGEVRNRKRVDGIASYLFNSLAGFTIYCSG